MRTNKGLIRIYLTLFLIGLATIILSITSSEHKEHVALFKAEVQNDGFEVVKKYRLAETRFVEGLEFIDDSHLLMSSGSYGDSHLDVLNIETDPVQTVKSTPLNSQYFGEGVSKADDEFIMMTYQNRKAFRFSSDLELLETMEMPS